MLERKAKLLFAVLFTMILVAGGFQGVAPAQDDEADDTPDIKALCKEVDREYKNRKNRNVERIIEVYGIFDKWFPKVDAKTQKSITTCLKKAYTIKPPIADMSFLQTNAACLSGMGKSGLDVLHYALKSKVLKPKDRNNPAQVKACLDLKMFIIESIGYSKQEAGIKTLMKLLWDADGRIIKSACSGLSRYNELELKKRKPIVEELVKVFANIHTEAIQNPKDNIKRERRNITEGAFVEALQKLTPERFQNAPDWQRWYNKNKSKKKW